MADRLFGIETEYAVTGFRRDGLTADTGEIVGDIMAAARRDLRCMPDLSGRGIFLENGSRMYVDCGLHPEIATPECADPWEVVRYVRAGDRILARLAAALRAKNTNLSEVAVFRGNVDYAGTGSTWGCHESYLLRRDPEEVADDLIPHLVSRILYTGAGGFNPLSEGLKFTLSPRVTFLRSTVSHDSTGERGIFHTRDEPLSAAPYRRLHLLCGESLCSDEATWLKVGATALVVAMADNGVHAGAAMRLAAPLGALRTFAADPECRAEASREVGRGVTALAIQRHYLSLAEAHLGAAFMPAWAPDVCRRWKTMLDRIDARDPALEHVLDWAIKRAIYGRHLQRRGLSWGRVASFNQAVHTLASAATRANCERRLAIDRAFSADSPVGAEAKMLRRMFQSQGLSVEMFQRFRKARRELFEIDTRFGQLETGIFAGLDQVPGVLAHRVEDPSRVEEATTSPPPTGRARIRGAVIHNAHGDERYRCEWERVWALWGRLVLDLTDPFETVERWREPNERERGPVRGEAPANVTT